MRRSSVSTRGPRRCVRQALEGGIGGSDPPTGMIAPLASRALAATRDDTGRMQREPRYWWHWWAVHTRWWWRDARVLVRETVREFGDDQCPQLAAGISYYVLFSIFPLALLALAVSGLVLADESLREDLVNSLFDVLPLSEGEGRDDLTSAISGLTTGISIAGLVSIIGLMWSASGMMGALRRALNQAWDTDYKRAFLHGKLVDFVMVLSLGMLVGLSVGTTIFLQVARRVSDDLSDALGPLGSGATLSLELVALFVPMLISFATFMVLFKVVPSVRTRYRSIWPGALLAAVLFEAVKNGFAIYLREFGNYDAVYGSLGTVVAFLFFVYISANVMLLGAEMAAEWPRVIHGHYDDIAERAVQQSGDAKPREPFWRRLRDATTGLVRGDERAPDHIEDMAGLDARRRRKADEIARRVGSR